MVSSIDGSPTITGWNLLSNAASRSMCFLYSSSVVAPIHWSSPLANAGFRILAASIAPSAAPAPISVWTSSITKITLPADFISSIIFFSLSSNSPLYFVPATRSPMSKVRTRFSSKISGISPCWILWAKPSAIAVLPTPGSPIKTGLFLVLLPSIWTTLSISACLPTTGSSFDSLANLVKFVPNSSNVAVFTLPLLEPAPDPTSAVSPSILITCVLTFVKSMPKFSRTLAATPSPSLINPRSKCSVPI